ncbi:MAG TPA: alpha/beta fold hydrolase [Candidatus Binatus sp.]|uniref:alpha/beta fold hydrolase n=1 Tax=Candidatus Binatus sp. TaxID=2811406 RepID=UPI002B478CD1|nr:alpha/beta fold hydrolase [Candidatus Binatus sp.]HKN12221.1 alpha/beta fold hydrolase [Candidatus Binatus sp.]
MPKIQVGELNLNYDVAGKGEPLLLIMGLGASSAQWDPELVAELARTFRVITFDNRDTGQSDKPDAPYSIEMFADDAAGVLDRLEVARAHVFGVSMGGMIAQEFGLRHQKRAATLTLGCTTAGGTHSVPPPPESLKILTAPREGVSPADVIRRGWPLGHTPKYIAENRSTLEAAIPRLLKYPTPPYAFQRQLEATYTLKTFDRLPQIKAPTLVITGAEDVLLPAKNSEIIAARIPGAKLHIIPEVGHAFMDAREEFLKVFLPFVKSHPMAA